jgi:hypothetical protein
MRLLGLITAAIISLESMPAVAWQHSSSAYYRSSDGDLPLIFHPAQTRVSGVVMPIGTG